MHKTSKNIVAYSVIIETIYCYAVGGIKNSHCGYKWVSELRGAVVIFAEDVSEVGAYILCTCYHVGTSGSEMGSNLVVTCGENASNRSYGAS